MLSVPNTVLVMLIIKANAQLTGNATSKRNGIKIKPSGVLGTGRKGWGEGYGGGRRGRFYIYRYTVTTRVTPALRWAAVRAILMFH